jgi:IS5 family transposase
MGAYEDKLPFDSSLMVYFRKRLTPEVLGEINEMIIAKNKDEEPPPDPPVMGEDDNESDESEPPNKGTLIVDATCAPQNIRYPQDSSLLNEARENLEDMVDELHAPADGEKPRTYRNRARRDYIKFSKKRKKTFKEIRKAIKAQLQYIRRDLRIIDELLEQGKILPKRHSERLTTIRLLYEQQLTMHNSRNHIVNDRIVSLGQPWVRPIVRGKANAKCEFGAKLEISVSDGFVRLEHTSFDAYNESSNLIEIVERYRKREGHYPERVLADGIYRNRTNMAYCRKNGIRISVKPLGRPKKDATTDKKRIRADEIDRVEVERAFSHAKGSFGLGLIRTRLKETSETTIALSIIALNLSRIGRLLRTLFAWFDPTKLFCTIPRNLPLVQ